MTAAKSKIAFTRGRIDSRRPNVELYVVNAGGTEKRRLLVAKSDPSVPRELASVPAWRDPGDDWGPSWSPDGQMVAFERDGASGEELHVMNADGSGDRRLVRNGVRFVIPFAWSPALPKRR